MPRVSTEHVLGSLLLLPPFIQSSECLPLGTLPRQGSCHPGPRTPPPCPHLCKSPLPPSPVHFPPWFIRLRNRSCYKLTSVIDMLECV